MSLRSIDEIIRENEALKRINVDLSNHINQMNEKDEVKVELKNNVITITVNEVKIPLNNDYITSDYGFCYTCLEEKKLCKMICNHFICFDCIISGINKKGFNLTKKCGMCRRNLNKKIYFKVIR